MRKVVVPRCVAVALLAAGIAAPTAARGAGHTTGVHSHPAATAPAAAATVQAISVGPIAARHGFKLTLEGRCYRGHDLAAVFRTGTARLNLSHTYLGRWGCAVLRGLGSGSLHASWGAALSASLTLTATGRPTRTRAPAGCRGRAGSSRTAVATGTLRVRIHPGVFGVISVHRARASLVTTRGLRCRASSATAVAGVFDGYRVLLTAAQSASRHRFVEVDDEAADSPAHGVSGFMSLYASGGRTLFDSASDLGSAVIGAAAPWLTGSMSFTALPVCAGSPNGRSGTLSGTLWVHDPVLGEVTLVGARAGDAFISRDGGLPGRCDGPGSIRPAARFLDASGCYSAGACSISAGSNAVKFFDQSDPGTGKITAESWNFGDGSPPVPGTASGAVTHTYAQPGTYTVTLTITDDQGDQETATQQVYIGG